MMRKIDEETDKNLVKLQRFDERKTAARWKDKNVIKDK